MVTKMQCNKLLIRANQIRKKKKMEKLFFRFECGNERALSLLSELSKRRQFYYIVGSCWLYLNTLGNSGIGYFANRIHHTSNPT